MARTLIRKRGAARQQGAGAEQTVDAVVVGAGFAGLYAIYRLRQLGLSVQAFERGSGVGGTWYWNRYPGARCDIPSLEYSYQFSEELQQEWEWSERYAPQLEILRYIEHVADRFDLRRSIRFDTQVESASFDEATLRWTVRTRQAGTWNAQFVILATGCLSSTNLPSFEGLDSFQGIWAHTGDWPREDLDFRGRRVGVIGTGSSGVQCIPVIAEQAEHLTVFQRTPAYSVPAHNEPLSPEVQARVKAEYPAFRKRNSQMPTGGFADAGANLRRAAEDSPEARQANFEAFWKKGGLAFMGAYRDLLVSRESNAAAADFVRGKIRGIVRDPKKAEMLMPRHEFGCKRLCADTGYYDTFNRPNVSIVDISRSPIERITPDGLRTRDAHYPLDCLVFATGFDAMTGSILRIAIRGRAGLPLKEKWVAGPRTYLGLMSEGYPNLFFVTGPGSPSVLSNMVPAIEQHVNWIADCIGHLRVANLRGIEASRNAEDAWVSHVNEVAGQTLLPSCNSWYLGANVPGKPRVFMPYLGFPAYVAKCNEVASKGYEGFEITP
ncbi:MAG TPA: NAD(P)/FAD-dependent oxidoreductase [Myxococcota bacterium]|nr:NAD(P)/FAD-dependent oxidoreductase [Myxococcota bacterium]